MSMSFFKRSPKSPASPKESDDGFDRAAYERRRQQVRRAQRNHRERKANYVKALEQEVVNLRNQNQHNIREFEEEIQMLHSLLLHYGQQPPPRQARVINPVQFDPNKTSSYTVCKAPGLSQALQLNVAPDAGGAQSPPQHAYPQSPSASSFTSGGNLSVPSAVTGPSSSDLSFGDTPVVNEQLLPQLLDKVYGINFVLALEHTCMGHPDLTRDEFGTHSHMATHNLLAFAPTDVSKAESWEVPGANIERLLALSNSFHLQGEITPAQAWSRLKQHPQFLSMKQNQLSQLKQLLISDSKCYGFGAVVEEQLWSLAVEEVFAQAARQK